MSVYVWEKKVSVLVKLPRIAKVSKCKFITH